MQSLAPSTFISLLISDREKRERERERVREKERERDGAY